MRNRTVASAAPRVIEVDIPSDVRYIERVVELVQHECHEMAFGSRQVMLNVSVALSEALSNAILRGNGDDPAKHVYVHAQVDRKGIVVEISDEGAGFDLDVCTADPTTAENVEREDGRGVVPHAGSSLWTGSSASRPVLATW